jgi:hypothetical protein
MVFSTIYMDNCEVKSSQKMKWLLEIKPKIVPALQMENF